MLSFPDDNENALTIAPTYYQSITRSEHKTCAATIIVHSLFRQVSSWMIRSSNPILLVKQSKMCCYSARYCELFRKILL